MAVSDSDIDDVPPLQHEAEQRGLRLTLAARFVVLMTLVAFFFSRGADSPHAVGYVLASCI